MLCKAEATQRGLGLPALGAGHVPRMLTLEFRGLGSAFYLQFHLTPLPKTHASLVFCWPGEKIVSVTEVFTHTLWQVKDNFLPAATSLPITHTDTADQIKKHKFFHANYGAKGQFAQKHVKNVDFSNPVIALPKG